MLRLWNTQTKEKEDFKSIRFNEVGFYACGPTVYGRAHIGNFRAYIMEDILRRTFEAEGFRVTHVMNITDVGHLTDDADSGEDKIEKKAREAGTSAWDISKMYTDLLLKDMTALHILKPTKMPRATETIDLQIELIQILEKKGYTYPISDGVYFDTSKWEKYGSFSGQPLEQKEEGARVQKNMEKRNPSDFALWKFSPQDQK
ncbi:MAG: cysteine--tRNA ligase, partial [bacterium]|nr:cysteine--tRNA ligase [bacterium]